MSPSVILVEGFSDKAALEVLAVRLGLDLRACDVRVEAMGGATNIRHFLRRFDSRVLGLCDQAERAAYLRAGLDPAACFVCVADLEDELIRALGVPEVEALIDSAGDSHRLRTFRKQPAQRGRDPVRQFRRFIACRAGAKLRYARVLTEALDPGQVPRPLAGVLAAALADCPA